MDTGGKDDIQRLQFHEYETSTFPLSLSFQIFSPCAMRHLVHTEHYKKNARGQALSRHFHPTLQSWLAHSISATGQASMPAVLLELRVLHTLFCDWLSAAHEAHEGLSPPHSTVSAESPWQGSSDCTISHLPALKSSGNQDSVPDIPLKHFASSISSFSRPLAESPVS